MSERTEGEGDGPPADVPDWFDAGGAEDADPPDGEGSARSAGAEAGDWFEDPDHRPIETGTESAGGDSSAPGEWAEREAAGTAEGEDEPTVEEPDEPTAGADEPTEGRTAESGHERGVGTEDRDGSTAEGTPSSATEDAPGSGDSEPAPGAGERTPVPDEGGSADGSAATAAPTPGGDNDPDDTRSPVRRLVAWFRSVLGRLS